MNKRVMIATAAGAPTMRGSGVAQVMQVMQVAGAPARTLPEGVSA